MSVDKVESDEPQSITEMLKNSSKIVLLKVSIMIGDFRIYKIIIKFLNSKNLSSRFFWTHCILLIFPFMMKKIL